MRIWTHGNLSREMSEEMSQQQYGDWRLERVIGQGAYGVVYLAVGSSGERAAVKICRRDAVGDERYERELRGAKLYRAIPSPKESRGAFAAYVLPSI